MSVLVRGMEMPKTCDNCPLLAQTDIDGDYCNATNRGVPWRWVRKGSAEAIHDRPDWCPLVPVPPHGRLIDADELRKSIRESIDECRKWANEISEGEMYARVSQSLGTFVECSLRIGAAPTIIPAEKGEE